MGWSSSGRSTRSYVVWVLLALLVLTAAACSGDGG